MHSEYDVLHKLANNELKPVGPELVSEQDENELAWLEERKGKITASNFGKIIPEGKVKGETFSKVGQSYLQGVVAERLGSTLPNTKTMPMRFGIEHEDGAIDEYETKYGVTVLRNKHTLHMLNEDVGGTPDFLIGGLGCGEVKCPHNPGNHINTFRTQAVPSEYEWQVHGHMLVTGRSYCDFVSFDPRIPEGDDARMCVIRVDRDEAKIEQLSDRLSRAAQYVTELHEAIKANAQRRHLMRLFESLPERERQAFLDEVISD